MLTYIVDAGSAITAEQHTEDFTHQIVVRLAVLHILLTLGTVVYALLLAAFPYLAPRYFLVELAPWALVSQKLAAGTAVESAGCYLLCVNCNLFHNNGIFLGKDSD